MTNWIHVDDRLPEINGPHSDEVLVFTDDQEYYTGFFFAEDDYDEEHWFLGDGWRAGSIVTVTHWMPLPTPPG